MYFKRPTDSVVRQRNWCVRSAPTFIPVMIGACALFPQSQVCCISGHFILVARPVGCGETDDEEDDGDDETDEDGAGGAAKTDVVNRHVIPLLRHCVVTSEHADTTNKTNIHSTYQHKNDTIELNWKTAFAN